MIAILPHRALRPLSALISVGAVLLFVGWPTARLVAAGLNPTSVREVLTTRRFVDILGFTIGQALLSTLITLTLAIPAGCLIGTRSFSGRRSLTALWSSSFTLPTVVVGSAFLTLLPSPTNRSLLAIVCAHTFFNVGMAARLIGDAWGRLDPRLDDAAATLGAKPMTVRRIMLLGPLRSTLTSVGGLVMALCLTSFGVIMILGGPSRSTTETEIYRQAIQRLALGRAAVLALIQLFIVGSVLAFTTTRSRQAVGDTTRIDRRIPLDASERPLALIICSLMTLVLAVPLSALVRTSLTGLTGRVSLRAYRSLGSTFRGNGLLDSPIAAVGTSVRSMALATAVAVLLMVATVYGTRGRLAALLAGLPLAVSGAILGFGCLLAFAHAPTQWRSSRWLVPVMQGIVALPYAVRAFRPAVDDLDPRLGQAAATLGAPPVSAWRRITARLLLRPFLAAAGLAAAVAIGEFGVTSFLVRPRRETIPVVIATLSSRPGALLHAQAAALAVILGALTMLLVSAASISGTSRSTS
jgi:thiamine transport system permease protein